MANDRDGDIFTNIFSDSGGWEVVVDPPATKDQRRALYRLGYSRSYVRKLTVTTADIAIRNLLSLRGQVLPPPPSGPTGQGTHGQGN